ncbi:MAG: extracellular solute-binding protein [Frisingicoccus sp.]|uniref:5'-nucleotidase C-terminal domain-containing protein n=1 Tax=Frisingicoccus sp. TaxID=1918627 RepID=UPI002609D301|nr:5'-nucleotidase C-terminal domain-containing protein [Frisingicoccus sp.]MDD6231768.1 extracellular solute-binding protein [Frisingicoccus sp.]
MKKRVISTLMIMVMLFSLAGCKNNENDNRVAITMYLWDKSMSRELTPWLETQFPDIDFTFVVGYNTMDFYTDLNKRGSLPDIITCRRFSLNDASDMSDMLMDLSETDVVGSYYDNYIENNRETGGAIRWLPMCAEVDGYIANVDLFEKYGIPLPENYAEFAEACRRFDELGLQCYVNDYREDYSCMEALQGCAIPELMTMEGIMWRTEYENENLDVQVGLDENVWPAVFDKFEQYMKDTMVEPEDVEMSFEIMKSDLVEGRAAIMRGTANDCALLRKEDNINTVMLPYFGETAKDNWLLTYPTCQVAVNRNVEQDEKKNAAVMQVLEAMFSEEGQKHVAVDNAVLSYNKNVNIEINDVFSQVLDCINSNHLYIRLASAEMFSVSKNVVQNMISGEYGAEEAYQDFHTQLTTVREAETSEYITTQSTGYAYDFGENGSGAASAVINTLRKQCGSDMAIGYSSVVTAPVFEGEYTRQQLNWLVANRESMRSGQITGSEIKLLMEWLVNVKQDGSNPIRHENFIPVTSGMEYALTDNGDGTYTLGEITVNGKLLDDHTVYSVAIFGDMDYIEAPFYCNCPMPEVLEAKMKAVDTNVYALFNSALEGGNPFEIPTEYVTIKR